MRDYNKQIVENLNTVLPTYYDMFMDSNTKTPCISYFIYGDIDDKTSSIYGWSRLTYCVKVWDTTVEGIQTYSSKVDTVMRNLGFRRIASNDMSDKGLICKILLYRRLVDEGFNKED